VKKSDRFATTIFCAAKHFYDTAGSTAQTKKEVLSGIAPTDSQQWPMSASFLLKDDKSKSAMNHCLN
jgi:hypothetical protein